MDAGIGFFENAKSGSNYIRFLIYQTTIAGDSIKFQYSTDPTGSWTDSNYDHPDGLRSGGSLNYEEVPAVIRTIGSRVHFYYGGERAGNESMYYGFSDDDGITWTVDFSSGADDGENVSTDDILDVFVIDSIPYGLVNKTNPDGRIYKLTDFSLIINLSGKIVGPGWLDEINDLYMFPTIQFQIANNLIHTFNGTTITNEDIGFDKPGDVVGSILLKKGNLQFLILAAFGASNDLTFIKYGNDLWSEFDFGGTNFDLKVGWEEDRYEPRFIHVGGSVDDLYYISDGGSLIKINNDATETVINGIGQFLHPYEVTFEDLENANNSKIFEKQLETSILKFELPTQVFEQGDGIVLRDKDSVEVFEGNVEEIITDLDGQKLIFDTPARDDLEREITVSFVAQTVAEIFQTILDTKCKFLHGTIASTVDTFTIKWDNTKIREIIKWGQKQEFQVFYWDSTGDSTFDDGTTGAITLNENNGDMTQLRLTDLGRKFNGVLLRGGLKQDGTIARLLRSDQKTSGIQLNIFTIDVPQMIDDTDLPGFEMYNYGTQVLSNLDSAFRNLSYFMLDQGKPQIGEKAEITSQLYSISAVDFNFFQHIYFPEEGNTNVQNNYNGLYFIVESKETLAESNREVLGQVSEELNNLGQIGTIYYLDSNASDIGGYKKALLTYAGAIEEDISVDGAVDGDPIEEFATEPNEPGITELLGGIYSTHIHASKTTGIGTKDVAIYFEMWKRASGGSEVLLGTSHATDIFQGLDNLLSTHIHLEDQIILVTDRIVIKYYVAVTGNGAAPDIEMHIQGDTTSRIIFPFRAGGAADPNTKHLMIGLANAEWITCPQDGGDLHSEYRVSSRILNIGADDFLTTHSLTSLPLTRGGLKLYINGMRIRLTIANATNYMDRIDTVGNDGIGIFHHLLISNPDDKNSANLYTTIPGAPVDASVYETVVVRVQFIVADAAALQALNPQLLCYYDT